jgi:serine/threonine-protein kinase
MVLDFGVCRMDSNDAEQLTGTGDAIGTVAYMAPEQIRAASTVDDRADLYSFGVLVFEMLTGILPHDGPTQMAILASKLENEPLLLGPATRVPVPDGLERLLAKTLVRDPADRFASAQDVLRAWRKLGAADGALSPDVPSVAVQTPSAGGIVARSGHSGSRPASAKFDERIASRPSVPVTATATAMAGAVALAPQGRRGRLALLTMACVLLGGLVSVGAFIASGPGSVHDAPIQYAPPAAETPRVDASDAPDAMAEANADSPAANSTSSAKTRPFVRPRAGHSTPTPPYVAPKSSGPQITSQPRY